MTARTYNDLVADDDGRGFEIVADVLGIKHLAIATVDEVDIAVGVACEDEHFALFIQQTDWRGPGVVLERNCVDQFACGFVDSDKIAILTLQVLDLIAEDEVCAIAFAE